MRPIRRSTSSTRTARRRPSAGLVVAMIALFVALGGSSYAAISLPKASVGTPQLKKGAVATSKMRNGAVTSAKVRDGSLLAKDFKGGQLPAGPQGEQGPQGDPGPQGEKGDPGTPGVSGYEIVTTAPTAVADGRTRDLTITCPAGKRVVGGGYRVGSSEGITLNRSGPGATGGGWYVRITNASGAERTIRGQAICVTVAG